MNAEVNGVIHAAVGFPPDEGPLRPGCCIFLEEVPYPVFTEDSFPSMGDIDCMACLACLRPAYRVRDMEGWRDRASLYRLSVLHEDSEFVIVSAIDDPAVFVLETFIFASNAQGACETMVALTGCFKGGVSHSRALALAGYYIVDSHIDEARKADE